MNLHLRKWLSIAWLSVVSQASFAGYFPMYASWEQPNGPGSDLTLTYSYSNLLDGSIIDSTRNQPMEASVIRGIFEGALQTYADVLPIHFVEITEVDGPLPETGEYDPTGLADIRVGQVANIDGANAYAYFPFSPTSGLAGDIVFHAERFGSNWTELWFFAVAQHELGHSLGMGHYVDDHQEGEGMNHQASEAGLGYQSPTLPLHPEMILALQNVYGEGVGSVTPVPIPAGAWLFGMGLFCLLRMAKGFSGRG